MKNINPLFLFLALAVFTGCNSFFNTIEISGEVSGMEYGTVAIKNLNNKTIFAANIKTGKFTIPKQLLQEEGYYKISFKDGAGNAIVAMFDTGKEIYLEPGTYFIKPGGGMSNYPIITTTSKFQNNLSQYHLFADSLSKVLMANTPWPSAKADVSSTKSQRLEQGLQRSRDRTIAIWLNVFKQFINKYPQNLAVAHAMANMNYESDPVAFYSVFKQFNTEAKTSTEGLAIGNRLSHLINLVPGAPVPVILGTTPNGNPVDIKALRKKIILIDFWSAGVMRSRVGHQKIIEMLPFINNPGFGVVSISLDDKRDWWTTGIADDHLTWTQVSDLQGYKSPNVDNWAIDTLPIYCLVDGDGRMIERGVALGVVQAKVLAYLAKH